MSITDPANFRATPQHGREDTLADILERVLDKGIVIAGDIMVNVLDIELLTLKVRLVVASVDTARDMGIDWWSSDPFLTGGRTSADERRSLEDRISELERQLESGGQQQSTGRSSVRAVTDGERQSSARAQRRREH